MIPYVSRHGIWQEAQDPDAIVIGTSNLHFTTNDTAVSPSDVDRYKCTVVYSNGTFADIVFELRRTEGQ